MKQGDLDRRSCGIYMVGNRDPQKFQRREIMKEIFEKEAQAGQIMTGSRMQGESGSEQYEGQEWGGWDGKGGEEKQDILQEKNRQTQIFTDYSGKDKRRNKH